VILIKSQGRRGFSSHSFVELALLYGIELVVIEKEVSKWELLVRVDQVLQFARRREGLSLSFEASISYIDGFV
jgi:hypothetical protein